MSDKCNSGENADDESVDVVCSVEVETVKHGLLYVTKSNGTVEVGVKNRTIPIGNAK